jgi:Family of unknown function (DUF6134)
MRKCRGFALGAIVLGCVVSGSALAANRETYTYKIEHPRFGDIGTYTDTLERDGDTLRIDTQMHAVVRILGIVVHREEANRTEFWRGDRLISFHSVTTINGQPIKVEGEATGNAFVITSPSGTVVGPANVYPSSPWTARLTGDTKIDQRDTLMSTKTGKLQTVQALGGEKAVISLNGTKLPVRHYEFLTNKRQDVWLGRNGVPVRFSTVENGTPIEFVLTAANPPLDSSSTAMR